MLQEANNGQEPPSASSCRPVAAPGHRRLVSRLLLIVAGSVLFTLALVPLYNVLCRVTGLNGRAYEEASFQVGGFNVATATRPNRVDYSRVVTVEFTTTVMPGLPWEMRPLTRTLTVHPGDVQTVKYQVHNLSGRTISGQAIPGVTPGQAARYFHKIECFCFAHQSLGPYEEREMVVVFVIRPDLDTEVRELTLAYAFFPLPVTSVTFTGKPAIPYGIRS